MEKRISNGAFLLVVSLIAAFTLLFLRFAIKSEPIGFILVVEIYIAAIAITAKRVKKGEAKAPKLKQSKQQLVFEPTEEVAGFRDQLNPDIRTCLCGTNYFYTWGSPLTVTDVFLWDAGNNKKVFKGLVVLNDEGTRCEAVRVLRDGGWKTYKNIPYLAKVVALAQKQPVVAQATADSDYPTTSAQTLAQDPVEADVASIPEDVLEQSTSHIWDDISSRVSSLIEVMISEKASTVDFEWPEGIQSVREAEMLAKKITDALELQTVVLKDDKKLSIILPTPEELHPEEDGKAIGSDGSGAAANGEDDEKQTLLPTVPAVDDTIASKNDEEPPVPVDGDEDWAFMYMDA